MPSNGKFHQTDQSKLRPFNFFFFKLLTYKSEADILLVQQKRVVFTVETVDCEVEKELMIGVDHDEQCSLIAADVV